MPLLRLFGHPVLESDGNRTALKVPAKAVALLAIVAANHSRPLSREWLAQILWPDTDPAQARANLRRHLHLCLRAIGDDALALTRTTVQWNRDSHTDVDVIRFDAFAKRQRESAADEYGGELCAGVDEAAIDDLRLHYRSEYEQLLRKSIEDNRAAQKPETLRIWLQRLVAFDPYDEQAVRDLMTLRRESGDRAGAVREYNALAHRLSAELGVKPQPETIALFAQLIGQDRQPGTPNNLLNPTTTFVGRERELAALAAALQETRIVALIGPGGIGKSRLATRACFDLLHAYPDGVWFVDLEHAKSETDVWQAIGDAAHLTAADAWEAVVLQKFATCNSLIVLDTCEHVLEGAGTAVERLAARTQAHVLATSRHRLGNVPAREIHIGALDVPPAVLSTGDSLLRYSAYRLFLERAATVSPAFRVDTQDAQVLLQLLHNLDGLPLAIELVASRANVLTLDGMRKRIAETLRTARGQSDKRNRTMEAALTWSYGLLSPVQCELLAALAVFRGTFTADDVDRVCAHVARAIDALLELLDASLVSVVAREDTMRYRLLETTRQFALDKLQTSSAMDRVCNAHAEYYATKADALARAPDAAFAELLDATLSGMPDFFGALDYAASSGKVTLGLRVLEGLHRFGMRNYFNHEMLSYAARLFERASGGERARIARLTGMLSEACGQYAHAASYFEIAAAYYRESGEESRLCDALSGLAVMAYHQGRYDECEQRFLEVREGAQRCGDTMLLLKTLGRLGALYLSQAQFEKSLPLLESAAAGLRDLGELRQRAFALKNLATAAHYAGRHKDAVVWVNEALQCTEATREIPLHAMALCMRAGAHRELGEMEQALDSLLQATQYFATVGESSDLAECLEDVASTICFLDEYEAPAELLGYCDKLRLELGSPINPGLRSFYDRTAEILQARLGATYERTRSLGAEHTAESACRLAVQTLKRLRGHLNAHRLAG